MNQSLSYGQHLISTKHSLGDYINFQNQKLDSCKYQVLDGEQVVFNWAIYYSYHVNNKLHKVMQESENIWPVNLTWTYYNDSLLVSRHIKDNSEIEFNYQFQENSISRAVRNELKGIAGLQKTFSEIFSFEADNNGNLQKTTYHFKTDENDKFWSIIFHYNILSTIDSIELYTMNKQQQLTEKNGVAIREQSGAYIYKLFELNSTNSDNPRKIIRELHFSDFRTFQCTMAYNYEEYENPWPYGLCEALKHMEELFYWKYMFRVPSNNLNKERYFVQLDWNYESQNWDSIYIQKFNYDEGGQIKTIMEREYDEHGHNIKYGTNRNFTFHTDSVVEIIHYYNSNENIKKTYFFKSSLVNSLETKREDNLFIYPNPSDANIQITSTTPIPLQIKIFKLSGTEVYSAQKTSNQIINIDHISPGTYIYQIKTHHFTYSGKLIKR